MFSWNRLHITDISGMKGQSLGSFFFLPVLKVFQTRVSTISCHWPEAEAPIIWKALNGQNAVSFELPRRVHVIFLTAIWMLFSTAFVQEAFQLPNIIYGAGISLRLSHPTTTQVQAWLAWCCNRLEPENKQLLLTEFNSFLQCLNRALLFLF